MQNRIVVLCGAEFIGTHLSLRLWAEENKVFRVDIRDATNSPLRRSDDACRRMPK